MKWQRASSAEPVLGFAPGDPSGICSVGVTDDWETAANAASRSIPSTVPHGPRSRSREGRATRSPSKRDQEAAVSMDSP